MHRLMPSTASEVDPLMSPFDFQRRFSKVPTASIKIRRCNSNRVFNGFAPLAMESGHYGCLFSSMSDFNMINTSSFLIHTWSGVFCVSRRCFNVVCCYTTGLVRRALAGGGHAAGITWTVQPWLRRLQNPRCYSCGSATAMPTAWPRAATTCPPAGRYTAFAPSVSSNPIYTHHEMDYVHLVKFAMFNSLTY
jgi:hypothetical protein